MTRIRKRGVELTPELRFCPVLGPGPLWEDFTDEDIEIGWSIHGAKIMEGWEFRHGSRPYGLSPPSPPGDTA